MLNSLFGTTFGQFLSLVIILRRGATGEGIHFILDSAGVCPEEACDRGGGRFGGRGHVGGNRLQETD